VWVVVWVNGHRRTFGPIGAGKSFTVDLGSDYRGDGTDEVTMETLGADRNADVDVAMLEQQDTTSVVLPAVSARAGSVAEGPSGSRTLSIPVSLSASTTVPVAVGWSTANATATAPGDYRAASGTVTFAAGETTKAISVAVNGDTAVEANETLRVVLADPVNATLATAATTATIVDDDKLKVATASLPSGSVGRGYLAALTGSGGTSPYRWKKVTKLPRGLRLNAKTGIISGTPKQAGRYTVTVLLVDKTKPRQTATATYSIAIG
jgi:chitinase